jgi:hypothetical protein
MNRERFVSLKEIINRVHNLGGDITNDVTEDDVITYIIELIGIVGIPALFQHKIEKLEIKKYRALLPCDFVEEEGVKCCDQHFNASTEMFDVRESKTNVPTYKIQGNYIVTSIDKGYIQLAYTAIKTDEDGYPMIVDDQAFIRALVEYIVYKRMQTEYINGRIDRGRYKDIEDLYETDIAIAESSLRKITIDEFNNITRMMNSFTFRVNSRKEGFANIGDEMPEFTFHNNTTSFGFINPANN